MLHNAPFHTIQLGKLPSKYPVKSYDKLLLRKDVSCAVSTQLVRGAFTFSGLLFFFSGMEADRNVKVVGGDVAVL